MRGTPLINSINNVHIILITGRLDLLPRASTMPRGKAKAIPVYPKTKVTNKIDLKKIKKSKIVKKKIKSPRTLWVRRKRRA